MYGNNYRPNNFRPNMRPNYGNNDRFIFPFITGALVGGAAVGLSRPRPIYATTPVYPQRPYPVYPYPYPYY